MCKMLRIVPGIQYVLSKCELLLLSKLKLASSRNENLGWLASYSLAGSAIREAQWPFHPRIVL